MKTPDDLIVVSGSRASIEVRVGALVLHEDRPHRIESVIDFSQVVCVDVVEGRQAVVAIANLSPYGTATVSPDVAAIDQATWARAQRRYAAIEPLLDGHTRRTVCARSKELGVSPATLYRWLAEFRGQRTTAALIPKLRGWRVGHSRLDPNVDLVIEQIVREQYLTPQRLPISRIAQQVGLECRRRNLPVPHYNAVSRRIQALPEHERLRARGARELAERKFRPVPGRFPEADFPLSVVQIDHTPLDVTIVDDEHRLPIGRPFLTLAIDVFSRMVVGYYLSLDAPCEASVGLCVARAMVPKEQLLQELGIEANWPVWGVMRKIHVDNGADFRSGSLRRSCELYGINLEFRPVKTPRFGGHIERLFGTVARQIHQLPGTTFSSVAERGEYRSDKHAAMTLDELERLLVRFICCVYHVKTHSAIGTSPLKRWEHGIFGDGTREGCGLAPRPTDARRTTLDFMPAFERQVRPTGVSIEGLTYYAEALRGWVGASDPKDPAAKRSFIFRRDPRDVSRIWFFDPETNDYYELPFADRMIPRMSLWEFRAARDAARKAGMGATDAHQVALAVERIRQDVDEAVRTTKSARRAKARRKQHHRAQPTVAPTAPPPAEAPQPLVDTDAALLEAVTPFEDVW